MKLKSIKIKNFRGYHNETELQFDDLTALVGKNDVGKSSILEALDIFFNENKGIHLPSNVTAMSLTYSIENSEYDNLTNNVDEYKQNKEDKSLFALMLYEVLIPDSTWR